MSAATNPPAAEFLRLIIEDLCVKIGLHASKHPLIAPLLGMVWSYLHRAVRRFERLVAQAQTGTLPKPRAPRASQGKREPAPARLRFPRGRAWLIRLVQPAAQLTGQLEILLASPEVTALLAAAPQAGRLLRPLAQMLGLPLPPALRPPPPKRVCPRPSPAPVATPAGQHPAPSRRHLRP